MFGLHQCQHMLLKPIPVGFVPLLHLFKALKEDGLFQHVAPSALKPGDGAPLVEHALLAVLHELTCLLELIQCYSKVHLRGPNNVLER